MANWTLEQELVGFVGGSCPLEEAVQTLGMLKEPLAQLRTVTDWRRGGAETFTYCFEALSKARNCKKFILKAYVPTIGTRTPDEYLLLILQRGNELASVGVSVPHCYGSGKGTALFDFIEHDAFDYLQRISPSATSSAPHELLVDLLRTAALLTKNGFWSASLLKDLRTDGQRVYLVDLGWDLGRRTRESITEQQLAEMRRWLLDAGVSPLAITRAVSAADRRFGILG